MRRIAVLGYLVTHAGAQLEFSPITQLGVEDRQDVSEIAPMIRQIAGAIFDQADTQIADREGAPGGLPRLAGMHGRGMPDQSVTVNGRVGIFISLLLALRLGPARSGPDLIEADHGVRDIGCFERGVDRKSVV